MRRRIIPYNPNLKSLARKLRNDSTPGEIILWNELSNKKMMGYDFHRQKPLLNYIVDFYCSELNLIIEIDGYAHDNELQYDKDCIREDELKLYDLNIMRFTEKEVRNDMFNVIRTIEIYIEQYKNTPLTPLKRGIT